MAQNASTHGGQQHYAVPQPMPWPIMGSASLFMMALGAVFVFNDSAGGWIGIAAGFMLLLYMMVRWFGDVIRESEGGKYGRWEDVSFRWGMSFFIFSEVMFFAAFFGALFWARVVSVPDLASIEHNALLGRDHHHRALEPDREQPRQAAPVARRDGRAGRRVPRLPGDRVRACVHRP